MEVVNIEIPMPKEILTLLNRTAYEMVEESKNTLAIDYYKTGKLPMSKCAEIIGATKEEFMRMLGRRGISFNNWDDDDNEIQKEIETVRKLLIG